MIEGVFGGLIKKKLLLQEKKARLLAESKSFFDLHGDGLSESETPQYPNSFSPDVSLIRHTADHFINLLPGPK